MLPNFLHVGAAKCASTWLWRAYQEHPEIYVPSQLDNVNFFVGDYHRGLRWYEERYFAGWQGEKAAGETSNSYMVFPPALERIRRDLPGVRLTVTLRNPIDRTFLHWAHMQLQFGWSGDARLDFSTMLDVHRWSFFTMWAGPSFYGSHLEGLLRLFPRERVLIMFYEDLVERPEWFIRSFFEFLEVDPDFRPSTLHTVVGFPGGVAAPDHPEEQTAILKRGVPEELRRELRLVFAEDIAKVEAITGRSLSRWR